MLDILEFHEPICIIGGSGRIGNKVMSILMKKYNNTLTLSLLLTRDTINKLPDAIPNYHELLNDKISKYNKEKSEIEQRQLIPQSIFIYSDIKMAYQSKNRIFIFCGKDSDEIRYFMNELKNIHHDPADPITFLSIADRLANDGGDLNIEYKNKDFISQGIFYHHADIITEAGEDIKDIIKYLQTTFPIEQHKYQLYDFWPGEAYGKAYNTTRKICRWLGCEATSESMLLTKTNMYAPNTTVSIHNHLFVHTARYQVGSLEVLPTYQWLRNKNNPTLPSIGIEISNNNGVEVYKNVFFFKDKEVGLIEDMGQHVHDKAMKKRTKDQAASSGGGLLSKTPRLNVCL